MIALKRVIHAAVTIDVAGRCATCCQHPRYIRTFLRSSGTVRSATRGQLKPNSELNIEADNMTVKVSPTTDSVVGFDYFKKLSRQAAQNSVGVDQDVNAGELGAVTRTDAHFRPGGVADVTPLSELELSSVVPALKKKSFSLAAYANDSETLSKLVELGVDMSKVELDVDAANYLLKMDFSKDVKPILLFLHQIGIESDCIAKCITKNPRLLLEPVDDMQVRVNYFESKKFSVEAIGQIMTKEPSLLTTKTKDIDTQLGYLQKDFMLTGDEVRLIITRFPKIAVWSKECIKELKMTLKNFLGFSETELKQLLIADPKIYLSGKHALSKRFDYLHNVIGYSHELIVQWPRVLRTRTPIIRQRHLFLKFLGRDQFDSSRENYVSPRTLVCGRDVEFCDNVAKVPVKQFNEFLKTL